MSDSNFSGYARVLARARVQSMLHKPLLGKPYLFYGQSYGLSGYFMQLGCVLGTRYRDDLDKFGQSFIGASGEPGAIHRFFSDCLPDVEALIVRDDATFSDVVRAEFGARMNFEGDEAQFLLANLKKKIEPVDAATHAWQFGVNGAILGTLRPEAAKLLFENTYKPRDQAYWDTARAAGLDIPDEQRSYTFEQCLADETPLYLAYCEECCPHILPGVRD